MRPTRLSALVTLALLLAAPAAPAGEEPAGLVPTTIRVRFRDGARPADSIRMTLRFPSELLPRTYDPERDGVVVTVGPVPVISFPPVDERTRLRRKDAWRTLYRERRHPDREGVRRLFLDLAAGRLECRARRLDLSALRGAGPAEVAVTLRLGESLFRTAVDFEERRAGWRYRAPKPDFVFEPFDPGGGGVPPGEPPPSPSLAFRVLATGAGPYTAVTATSVARNLTDYQTIWFQLNPPPPPGVGAPVRLPPSVDFAREIVVAVNLGLRPTGGYEVRILDVVREGTGARVLYEERKPGPNCPVPMLVGSPYLLAAITRVEGPVLFQGKVTVFNCP